MISDFEEFLRGEGRYFEAPVGGEPANVYVRYDRTCRAVRLDVLNWANLTAIEAVPVFISLGEAIDLMKKFQKISDDFYVTKGGEE